MQFFFQMHGNSNDRRALEREALRNVINQWNANRLDLFELSMPNEVKLIFLYLCLNIYFYFGKHCSK